MKKQLKPSFYDEFRCVANSCECSCCEKWRILIDKKTYKKYMSCNGKNKFKNYIEINTDRKSTADYAKIKLNKEEKCSFLDEEGLCRIHSEFGNDMLSNVCRSYPRENIKIGNLYEHKLSISCPEVAKIALLNKKKYSFILDDVDKVDEEFLSKITFKEHYFDLLWEVRSFSIEIIQSRNIEFWKRIMLLGLFCKEIDKHIKNQDEVTNIINKYKIMINDREVLNSLENITLNNERKLNLVIQFIKNRTKYVLSNEDFIDLCNDLENTLGFSETASIDSIILNYEKLENEEYKKFLISNSYIFENYLVNTIYKEFVFFYETMSFYEIFVKIIVQYSIVRFLLLGQLAKKKEDFNDNDIIRIFYSFSRSIEHSPVSMKDIIQGLKQKGYDKLNYMSILIRE